MDRLTKRNKDGVVSMAVNCPNGCEYYTCNIDEGPQCNHQCEADIVCKLAEYEDAEEQGLILRLPCPIGTKVYEICEDKSASTVKSIEYEGHTYRREIPHYFICISAFDLSMISKLGISAFLTQEAAEQALKQMGE